VLIRTARGLTAAILLGASFGLPTAAADEHGPIYVRPGAPGEPTQRITAASIAVPRSAPFSQHEVHFVQHMMVHHGQAVTMAALVPDRAADPRLVTLARQIDMTQDAELSQMTRWLQLRNQEVPDPFDAHGHEGMPGMVPHHQMEALAASSGREFDVRFLEAMIYHHLGAVEMANELERATGGFLEPNISVLAVEIVDHQETEIKRMRRLLAELRS
jgi:uncharacterized protein (DUF305 family)